MQNEKKDFHAENHPEVNTELLMLIRKTEHLRPLHADIIVSFLKDHMIKTEWVKENPELTRLITSGPLRATHTERLFESYRNNRPSLLQVEDYIYRKLITGIPKEVSIL